MKKRICSILTALALYLTMLPTAAWAAEPGAAVWTVTAFEALAEDVAQQTLPQLVEDGETQGPNLPGTLTATAYQVEDDTQPIIIEVTWEAEPDFDQAAPGDYVYTPALPEGYALAEGVEPPTITVTVEAAPDPQDEPPQDTLDETPTVEDEPVAYTAGDTTADVWNGGINTDWYDSTNPQDTYTLTTAEQLAGLAELVNGGNNFSGKTIKLGADIVLNEDGAANPREWTFIGKYIGNYVTNFPFQGTFDGQGHTVSNLYINIECTETVHAGLFGYVKYGTVKNLAVSGTVTVAVTSGDASYLYTGGVVGGNSGTVENCSFSGTVKVTDIVKGSVDAGGVIGESSGAVTNCSFDGTVTVEAASNHERVAVQAGGVVGWNSGTVTNCYSTGTVEGVSTSTAAGGVAGLNNDTVKNCYNTGSVTATGTEESYSGGVVGWNNETVTGCYYLTGTASQSVGYSDSKYGFNDSTDKDSAAFASGEVAYLLSGGANQDPDSPWRQNLGTNSDTAPTLDSIHAQVVQLGTAYVNASTEDDETYYLIYTAEQLKAFASAVNGGQTSINAKLMNNIDLSTVCGATIGEGGAAVSWTPIGNSSNSSNSFKGTFDGQGHTVKGLYMNITRTGNYSTYGGLFGNVEGGTVKNLNVNGTVTVTNEGSLFVYVGGVVGYADGPSGALSTVENCSFAGEVTGTSGYSIYVGGVVGPADKATVRGCSNSGTVTANGQDYSYAGGVVGRAYDGTTVENCYNTGAVTGTGSDTFYVGGVAGYIYLTTTMKNCYNTGTVSGPSGGNVGGVVGGAGYAVNYPSTVENCYFLQDTGTNTGLSGIGYDESLKETSNDGAEAKNTSAFASGEVAHLLQADQATQYWGQTLGADEVTYPVLTSDEDLSVVKVTFMVKDATRDGYTKYAEKYTNAGGTVALPADPAAPSTHAFCGWYTSSTEFTEANRFTGENPVTESITVYAGMQLQYGAAEGGKTVNTTYGVGATVDLSEYIAYADDATSAAKNFSYTIVSGNEKGYFSLSGDTLTVSSSTPASTYTLTITATEQTPQISLFSTYSFGTSDVTFTVTVVVAKADPEVTAPAVKELTYTVEAQELVTAGSTTGGTLKYSTDENGTYSETIPMGTNAGTYTVYYKVEGDDNYNGVDADSVTVTIAKATPTYVAPTGLTAVSGQTLASVKLPSGWAWADGTQSVDGGSEYKATYTPSDTNNYSTVTVDITITIAAKVDVEPGETVQIGDTTVTNKDGGTVTVTGEDGTEITVRLPEGSDSVAVDGEGNVTVPDDTTVTIGDTEITLPSGGTVDGDGNVTGETVQIGGTTITAPEGETVTTTPDGTTTAPGGTTVQTGDGPIITLPDGGKAADDGSVTAGTVQIGDTTITAPEGETVTTTPDGTTTAPGGTTVQTGDGPIITLPDGGEVADDGSVTAETVQVGDTTITAPEGETVTTTPDGTTTAPSGSTVQTGDGPIITLPNGGEAADDGSVTAGTVQVGDITITAPEGETVTTTPDGATTAPGGSTVTVGDTTITIGEDTTDATVDENGGITLPSGGTVTLETGDGKTVIIEVPKDGTVSVGDDGKIVLPGGTTVTVGDHTTTIPTAGGELNVSTGAVTINSTNSGSNGSGGSSTPTYTPTVEKTDNGTVTVSPKSPKQGTTVTIIPKPDSGYEVDTVTVTGQNGKMLKVTDNGDGTYSFTQPAYRVTVEVTFTERQKPVEKLPFTDVPESAYYYDAVKWAVENGVTAGTTATTFSPNAPCTRAQAITFLWRAAGSPEPVNSDCPFTDLQPGDYYYKAVLWAVENGITSGTSASTFGPDDTCTRAQIVTFLYRAAGRAVAGSPPFADVQESDYFFSPVLWAVKYSVTAGTSAATFGPNDTCTRAQIVTFLYRVYE